MNETQGRNRALLRTSMAIDGSTMTTGIAHRFEREHMIPIEDFDPAIVEAGQRAAEVAVAPRLPLSECAAALMDADQSSFADLHTRVGKTRGEKHS